MTAEPPGVGLEELLFERRTVLLSAAVGLEQASGAAARLMALDAMGDDPVELRVSGRCESLDVAFTLIDTIDVLGVAVHALVLGEASGTLPGVVSVCRRRRIGPSGRMILKEPSQSFHGSAASLEVQAAALDTRWQAYLHRVSEATGRPFEHLEADHRSGRVLDAGGAVAYGLVDEIA